MAVCGDIRDKILKLPYTKVLHPVTIVYSACDTCRERGDSQAREQGEEHLIDCLRERERERERKRERESFIRKQCP